MEIGKIPWLLAFLTALWFGWMASRAARNWILWAVGGAAFGLVTSTIVIGLLRAGSIPFSDQQRQVDHIKGALVAAILILIGGWLLTSSLHRHHLAIWRILKPDLPAQPKTAAEAAAKQRPPNG